MTGMLSGPGGAAVMRAADAETMASDAVRMRMLLDASATNGAVSTVQVGLREGADGAVPHRHDQSSEMFYVLDGQMEVLAGDQVLQASAGDLVVVPPGLPHAFGAPRGSGGELLIVITPQESSGSSTSGT